MTLVCPQCDYRWPDHLFACPNDGQLLQPIADEDDDDEDVALPDAPGAGDLVGNYRLIAEIGRGGMGVVFRAVHEHLQRDVAIKVLHPHFFRRGIIFQRFLREARAIAFIRHPNIVHVTDLVMADDHPPYMIMELLSGETLARYLLRRGKLPPWQALEWAEQICYALAAVHERNVIHRDLKPDNLFVVHPDEPDAHIKLLDFGIAKFKLTEEHALTSPGLAIGTPEYMAPEQVTGREVDARTDIYALGIILYEMLTGLVPFSSENTNEVMVMQARSDPLPPSAFAELRDVLPPSFERVILDCLEKHPEDRFQSMGALRQALERAARDLGPGPDVP